MEADTFWCLSRLLDGIQDNYISGQPGIHRSIKYLNGLVARVDGTHNGIHRFMSNLTMRSTALQTSSERKRRVYAVRIPVDELSTDARAERKEYDSDVGHLPGKVVSLS